MESPQTSLYQPKKENVLCYWCVTKQWLRTGSAKKQAKNAKKTRPALWAGWRRWWYFERWTIKDRSWKAAAKKWHKAASKTPDVNVNYLKYSVAVWICPDLQCKHLIRNNLRIFMRRYFKIILNHSEGVPQKFTQKVPCREATYLKLVFGPDWWCVCRDISIRRRGHG